MIDYALRPAIASDNAFLAALFASTREEEMARSGWPEEFKAAFCAQQFAAQTAHYRQHYADASFSVIEIESAPVGRFIVHRQPDRIQIVDISLMPSARGRGLGTRLIESLFIERKTIGLCVERMNRARQLYDRLGFQQVADDGMFLRMEWHPARLAFPSISQQHRKDGPQPFDQTDAMPRVL